jgi:DNA mismatch repair protein MutL
MAHRPSPSPSASTAATYASPPGLPGDHGRLKRLSALLGHDFQRANALLSRSETRRHPPVGIRGLPTYSRGNAAHRYVRQRPPGPRPTAAKGALRGAYADFLARDRRPAAVPVRELVPSTSTSMSTQPRPRSASAIRPGARPGRRPAHALAGGWPGHRASTTVADNDKCGLHRP